eukprot:CFRG1380T1
MPVPTVNSETVCTDNVWVAASDNNFERVKALIEDDSVELDANSKDDSGYTPMHAAAGWGHKDLLMYLISVGGNVNIVDNDDDTPLHITEDTEIAQILLDAGADLHALNSDGFKPIDTAREEAILDLYLFLRQKMGLPPMASFEELEGAIEEAVKEGKEEQKDRSEGSDGDSASDGILRLNINI